MTSRPAAVFRFDASRTIGGGHAMRSAALATALAREGWRTVCATRNETIETTPGALELFDEVVRIGGEGAGEIDEIVAHTHGPHHAVVVDHYERDWRFDRACRRFASCVTVIEDRPEAVRDCDILVNQSIEPKGPSSGGAARDELLGPRYALLRPDFRAARARGGRDKDEGCLLLLCGLTDERNLTEHVFDVLDGAPGVRMVHVVIGSANAHRERLRRRMRHTVAPACLHVDPSPLADLMTRASLAVTAAGSTCWELACLGVPMITIVAAANQVPVARTLRAAGASESAGAIGDTLGVRLREKVAELMANGARRRRMGGAWREPGRRAGRRAGGADNRYSRSLARTEHGVSPRSHQDPGRQVHASPATEWPVPI